MWRFEALRKVPLLAPLTPAQRSNLCTVLRAEHYKRGGVIIRQVLGLNVTSRLYIEIMLLYCMQSLCIQSFRPANHGISDVRAGR